MRHGVIQIRHIEKKMKKSVAMGYPYAILTVNGVDNAGIEYGHNRQRELAYFGVRDGDTVRAAAQASANNRIGHPTENKRKQLEHSIGSAQWCFFNLNHNWRIDNE